MEGVLEEEGRVECEDGAKIGSAEAEGDGGEEARRTRKQKRTMRDPYTLPVRRRASPSLSGLNLNRTGRDRGAIRARERGFRHLLVTSARYSLESKLVKVGVLLLSAHGGRAGI